MLPVCSEPDDLYRETVLGPMSVLLPLDNQLVDWVALRYSVAHLQDHMSGGGSSKGWHSFLRVRLTAQDDMQLCIDTWME